MVNSFDNIVSLFIFVYFVENSGGMVKYCIIITYLSLSINLSTYHPRMKQEDNKWYYKQTQSYNATGTIERVELCIRENDTDVYEFIFIYCSETLTLK